jgi:hypothetical protein
LVIKDLSEEVNEEVNYERRHFGENLEIHGG